MNFVWWKLYSFKLFIKSCFGYYKTIDPIKHAWFINKNKHLIKKIVTPSEIEKDLQNL